MRALLATAVALLASFTAAPATAQTAPPPRFQEMDENGVDLISGRFVLKLVEGSIGTGEGAVRLTRTQRNDYGVLNGWSAVLYTAGGGTIFYVDLGNRLETFTYSGGVLQPSNANGATLTTTGGGYLYRDSDGTTYTFDIINSGSGAPLVGSVCSNSDPGSCTLASSITRPDGTSFTLGWYFFEACPTVEPLPCPGGEAYFRFQGPSSSTGYSFSITYANNAATGVGGPSANWYRRTGATFDNAVSTPSPVPTVTYSTPSSGVEEVTDTGGRTWRIASSGTNVTGFRRPGSSTDDITVSYGTGGVVTSVTRDGVTTGYSRVVSGTTATTTITNALSQQTVVVANTALQRVTSVTDALSRTTSFQYDTSARLTRVTFHEGNYISYTYDSRGNLTQTQHVPKSGSGSPTLTTSASYPSGCTDPLTCNRPTATTDARNNVTDYEWSATHGGLVRMTAPAPTSGADRPETRYDYTLSNGEYRLTAISACQSGTAPGCIDTANELRTVIAYDANANITSMTRRNGSNTVASTRTMTYDAVGNRLTVDGPLSGTADTTRYRYNSGRQIIGVIGPDPDGGGSLPHRAVRTTYRSDGQPIRVERGTVNSQSDPDWANFASLEEVETDYDANDRPVVQRLEAGSTAYSLTQTSYDAIGRVQCVAQRMNTAEFGSLPTSACTLDTEGSFGPDRIVRTTYDAAGQVTLVQSGYGVTGVEANEVAVGYTANGQVAHVTDGQSNRTTYEYDGLDRLVRTYFPVTTAGQNQSSTTDYEQLTLDPNGNVTTRRLRDGNSIAFAYDALDRAISKDLPGSELTVSYAYDLLGRLTSASTSAQTLSFTFDALGRNLTQSGPLGTNSSQYDAAGRRTRFDYARGPSGLEPALYVTYDYLVTGDMTHIRENGSTALATFVYDLLGRRDTLTYGNGALTDYGYDAVSRLTSLGHDLPGSTTYDQSATFSYNPAGQIAGTTRSNDVYAYDGLANVNRTDTHNGLNQIAATGGTSVTHDSRGNMTSDGTRTFGYSSENLLTSVGGVGSYGYDPLNRLWATAPGYRVGYDGNQMVDEYNSSMALLGRFVLGPGIDEALAYIDNQGNRLFLQADERGSVTTYSNNSGGIASVNRYDDYGQPGVWNARWYSYTGQLWIPEIGLHYYKARMYHPGLGRFVQTDPIGYGDGMNLYAYVHNDPVNLTDPLGLSPDCSDEANAQEPECGIVVIGRRLRQEGPSGGVNIFARDGTGALRDFDGGGGGGGQPQDICNAPLSGTANRGHTVNSRRAQVRQELREAIQRESRSGREGAFQREIGRNLARLTPNIGTWIRGGTSRPDGNYLYGAITAELGISLSTATGAATIFEWLDDALDRAGWGDDPDESWGNADQLSREQIRQGARCPG